MVQGSLSHAPSIGQEAVDVTAFVQTGGQHGHEHRL
jgi:hypothetical protein